MSVEDDRHLLRAWTEDRNEAAFRRLLERYAGLVHGAALRRAGDAELAAEAAQDAFIRLAKHAAAIHRAESLPSWLHVAAVRAAANRVRSESRHRERMKHYQHPGPAPDDDTAAWREALPWLDEAIAGLSDTDRGLVLARYCQGETVASAARRYGLTPAAAQKRGARALEKLAGLLRRRGVVITATVLASGMTEWLAHPAPGGVVAKWSAAAVAASSSSGGAATGAWIALMNAKAVSIVAAIAALCVPVGLQLHANASAGAPTRTGPLPDIPPASASPSVRGDSPRSPDPRYVVNGVDLTELAREIRSFPPRTGRLRRELELRAVMRALDPAQCAIVAEWLAAAPALDQLTWVVEDLFRHWTVLDRSAALKAAESVASQHSGPRTAVLTQWAHMDAQGLLNRFSPELQKGGKDVLPATACRMALRALAERNPGAAVDTAQRMETAPGLKLVDHALMGWVDGESPEAPLAWVASLTDSTQRKARYESLIGYLQDTHPDKAWASLVTWPDRVAAQDLACSSMNLWAAHDPQAAASAWLAGPEVWRNRHFAFNLAQVLRYADPDYAERLADAITDPALREYYSEQLKGLKALQKK